MSVFMGARKQFISVFGFSESERRALKSMFKLAGTVRDLAYGVVNPEERITADIALVDADDPQAVNAWRREHESHTGRTPAVMVSKSLAINGQHVCISRPLTMKKVLGALDEANHSVKIQEGKAYGEVPANVASRQCAALVVDDSLAVRRFMEDKLGTLGVPVDLHFAASGEQALALAQEKHYDIIFLDIMLPGIDGYRVCKSLKAARGTRNSPVVMLTSKKSPFDRVKGSMAGCDAYLVKPPDDQRLDAIIRKYILRN
jgi:two-component system cell cycle response regulator